MLAVSVELLHGTLRADPIGAANTGRLARGEWPPAPFRLFAAFVAADGTRDRSRFTDGRELKWLEGLRGPVIHAHPEVEHQVLNPRFVVEHKGSAVRNKTHQEYVARKGTAVRPGVRVSPREPRIVYAWPVETPSSAVLAALRLRAARIGYLGAADSPVRVRVLTELPARLDSQLAYRPDPDGDTVICVTARGDVQVLDAMYDAWTRHGADVARAQFPALRHEVRYSSPGHAPDRDRPRVVWLRLDQAISGRRIGGITALFKEAVLSKYQSLYGEPPAVLHGHGFRSKGYEIARYLALPEVGHRWSRGRIHGLALWTPPGWDALLQRQARDAAHAVRRLSGPGVDVRVMPRDRSERRPLAAHPATWERRSHGWVTAFPAIHERRRPVDLAEVTRWCAHAGLPSPVRVRSTRGPLVSGAVDLAPVEVNRPGRPGRPYSHVEIWFDELVRGPVVIGSGRQRGFGLCVSVDAPGSIRRKNQERGRD